MWQAYTFPLLSVGVQRSSLLSPDNCKVGGSTQDCYSQVLENVGPPFTKIWKEGLKGQCPKVHLA